MEKRALAFHYECVMMAESLLRMDESFASFLKYGGAIAATYEQCIASCLVISEEVLLL